MPTILVTFYIGDFHRQPHTVSQCVNTVSVGIASHDEVAVNDRDSFSIGYHFGIDNRATVNVGILVCVGVAVTVCVSVSVRCGVAVVVTVSVCIRIHVISAVADCDGVCVHLDFRGCIAVCVTLWDDVRVTPAFRVVVRGTVGVFFCVSIVVALTDVRAVAKCVQVGLDVTV